MAGTPINNQDYLWSYRKEALKALEAARAGKKLTYDELAKRLDVSEVWLGSAFHGQQYMPLELTVKLAKELGTSPEVTAVLAEHPYKGNVDPILYRLHEMMDVYGPTIKAIIHEKFADGNGIMSAIDFTVDVKKVENPKGDRVVITLDGKFLPYSCAGKYPW